MNRVITDSPLTIQSDYVLDLVQDDGSPKRLCVTCGSGQATRSLFLFLENLCLRGLISRGGGSRIRQGEFKDVISLGVWSETDHGQPHPVSGPCRAERPRDEEGLEDPFTDPDVVARIWAIEDGEVVYTPADSYTGPDPFADPGHGGAA